MSNAILCAKPQSYTLFVNSVFGGPYYASVCFMRNRDSQWWVRRLCGMGRRRECSYNLHTTTKETKHVFWTRWWTTFRSSWFVHRPWLFASDRFNLFFVRRFQQWRRRRCWTHWWSNCQHNSHLQQQHKHNKWVNQHKLNLSFLVRNDIVILPCDCISRKAKVCTTIADVHGTKVSQKKGIRTFKSIRQNPRRRRHAYLWSTWLCGCEPHATDPKK